MPRHEESMGWSPSLESEIEIRRAGIDGEISVAVLTRKFGYGLWSRFGAGMGLGRPYRLVNYCVALPRPSAWALTLRAFSPHVRSCSECGLREFSTRGYIVAPIGQNFRRAGNGFRNGHRRNRKLWSIVQVP